MKVYVKTSASTRLRRVLAAALIGAAGTAAAAPSAWTLGAAEWAAPRTAERVLGLAGVAAAVRALLAAPQATLVLNHPATEAGTLWAEDLRDWLVALGVEPRRIDLAAGKSAIDQLSLAVASAPAGRSAP